MDDDDLYEVLQVSPRAEPEVIESAYRRLSRKHHPDVNGDSGAAYQQQRLNAAYAILSDPTRRRDYDRQRDTSGAAGDAGPGADADASVRRTGTAFQRPIAQRRERPNWLLPIGGLLLVAALTATGGFAWQASRSRDERPSRSVAVESATADATAVVTGAENNSAPVVGAPSPTTRSAERLLAQTGTVLVLDAGATKFGPEAAAEPFPYCCACGERRFTWTVTEPTNARPGSLEVLGSRASEWTISTENTGEGAVGLCSNWSFRNRTGDRLIVDIKLAVVVAENATPLR